MVITRLHFAGYKRPPRASGRAGAEDEEEDCSGAVVDWAWSAGSNAKKGHPAKQVQSTRAIAGPSQDHCSSQAGV